MKLEYQAIELRRGDKWHCNFCSFEKEKSLTATYKMRNRIDCFCDLRKDEPPS